MTIEIRVPDIGDFKDVPVIEIHVQPGDAIKADDPLVTLESDKATMDVPASHDGVVGDVLVKVGDRVSEGSPIIRLQHADTEAEPPTPPPPAIEQQEAPSAAPAPAAKAPPAPPPAAAGPDFAGVHASPSVRRLARELDIEDRKSVV